MSYTPNGDLLEFAGCITPKMSRSSPADQWAYCSAALQEFDSGWHGGISPGTGLALVRSFSIPAAGCWQGLVGDVTGVTAACGGADDAESAASGDA